MEVQKRKRPDDGETDDGKKLKSTAREDDNTEGVKQFPEDEEVEEFFAILRRIHVAVKYFEKRNRDGDRELTTASAWSPSFERKDFEYIDAVKKGEGGSKEGEGDTISGLDLNSDPVRERSNPESI